MEYFKKMRGTTQSPPRVGNAGMVWSWVGAFVGIALLGLIGAAFVDRPRLGLSIGSFGAMAVLVNGAVRTLLAQSRNVLGGLFFPP